MIRQEDVSIVLKDAETLQHTRKDYIEYHQELSSKAREISVLFQDKKVLDVTVPPGVFNPYGGIAAQAFMSGVLSGEIDVKGKKVVDLGCGCGVAGWCCVLKESEKVLFTDINPNVIALKDNPMLRPQDEVKVQDLCAGEEKDSYDVVLMGFPSRSIERTVDYTSYESGILRNDDLIFKTIDDVGRVLKPGGKFVFFYRVFNDRFPLYLEFTSKLAQYFDISSVKLLWYSYEATGHGLLLSVDKASL
ncbi:MAG: methyltransferase [Oscillatoria sp. SIO1A7]|nr:methyltransferase [Oscillatoria sp. SIO1A7]